MVDDDMEDGMRRSMSEEIRRRTTIVCDGYYAAVLFVYPFLYEYVYLFQFLNLLQFLFQYL